MYVNGHVCTPQRAMPVPGLANPPPDAHKQSAVLKDQLSDDASAAASDRTAFWDSTRSKAATQGGP